MKYSSNSTSRRRWNRATQAASRQAHRSFCPTALLTVEKVRAGDMVTTIGKDSAAPRGRCDVFMSATGSSRQETGVLVTTETQPLVLATGELREAGELKAGDKIWRWDAKVRQAVVVKSVTATGRQEKVYNLILKDKALFVANGFLARSKPPAPSGELSPVEAVRPR